MQVSVHLAETTNRKTYEGAVVRADEFSIKVIRGLMRLVTVEEHYHHAIALYLYKEFNNNFPALKPYWNLVGVTPERILSFLSAGPERNSDEYDGYSELIVPYCLHLVRYMQPLPKTEPVGEGQFTIDLNDFPPLEPKFHKDVRRLHQDMVTLAEKPSFFDYIKPTVSIPTKSRFQHTHILGQTGSGKTVLLKHLISKDSNTDCSLIVMAPKGDLIPTVLSMDSIDEERFIVFRPDLNIALNIFDVKHDSSNSVGLINYVFGSLLDTEPTQKQTALLNHSIRLLLHIPNATVLTLRTLMKSETLPPQFAPYLTKLPPATQEFFTEQFDKKRIYGETKEQIMWRLDLLLENPTVAQMLSSPETKINMLDAMEEGKVVLIDTAIKDLGDMCSTFIGRLFIALVNLASRHRKSHKPVYFYIDEASQYLDRNIETLLEMSRESNIGLTFAHQQLAQFPAELSASIRSNTLTKIVGGCSFDDARSLSKEMYVEPEVLNKQGTFQFHVHNKSISHHSFKVTVPPETFTKRSNTDAILERSRALYGGEMKFTMPVKEIEPIPDDDVEDFFAS